MNKVIAIGRIVKDPELKTTSTNKKYTKFSIAVNDLKNNKQTYFLNCTAWEQQADYVTKYLKKGFLVSIDGRITINSYVSREGRQIQATDIVVDSIRNISARTNVNTTQSEDESVSASENNNSTIDTPVNFTFENANTKNDSYDTKISTSNNLSKNEEDLEWIKDLE